MKRIAVLGLAVAIAVGCAPKTFTRPTGAGVPAPDAADLWSKATSACSDVQTFAPALEVAGGRLEGRRLPSFRIDAGLTTSGDIFLSAHRHTQSLFELAGTGERAQLVLSIEPPQRVVLAPAREIVDALIGLDLDPVRLLRVLTACVGAGTSAGEARRVDRRITITAGDTTVYLENRDAQWRVAGADVPGLRVDYPEYAGAWPSEIVMVTADPGRASLRVRVHEHHVNSPQLNPKAFAIRPAPSAVPMTVDELRQAFGREPAKNRPIQ